ncbi:MAG: TspO/MBR family protein [Candidatus Nanoarchaeia archaeon]
MKIDPLKLAFSIILISLAGLIGGLSTSKYIPTWYASIKKPSFNPPNWIFGPVWTTLYVLMGISFYLVWSKGLETKQAKTAITLFIIQLILNVAWSIIFFGMQSPLYAFIEIIILWVFILLTIIHFYKISKPAAYLLIPYILWVSFAAILNFSIYYLNK